MARAVLRPRVPGHARLRAEPRHRQSQQIKAHITFHTNGELILYPYGYTRTNVPADMRLDDHRAFVAMARRMAKLNGFTAQQSSDLYITDGDQIDWMYARYRIFSFTLELYPPETIAKPTDHEPPDEVIADPERPESVGDALLPRAGWLRLHGDRQDLLSRPRPVIPGGRRSPARWSR